MQTPEKSRQLQIESLQYPQHLVTGESKIVGDYDSDALAMSESFASSTRQSTICLNHSCTQAFLIFILTFATHLPSNLVPTATSGVYELYSVEAKRTISIDRAVGTHFSGYKTIQILISGTNRFNNIPLAICYTRRHGEQQLLKSDAMRRKSWSCCYCW